MRYRIHVNGAEREVDVPPATPLLEVLREELGLFAARPGCGQGRCGACFVLADGRAVASCTLPVGEAVGHELTTVEGLASGDRLHPIQEAFLAEDALQCGYCTSGLLVSAVALLRASPSPTEAEIRDALAGNLCRCGVHGRIVSAVRRAASRMPAP